MNPKDSIEKHFRLLAPQKAALARLGLQTLEDLLFHIPFRYESVSDLKTIASLRLKDEAVVCGTLEKLKTTKTFGKRKPVTTATLKDHTGSILVRWFFQPYLGKMLEEGSLVKVTGTVSGSEDKLYLANPRTERIDALPIDTHDSLFRSDGEGVHSPMYPESKGISSLWFFHAAKKLFSHRVHEQVIDIIPEDIRTRLNLPSLSTALVWIHTPQSLSNAEAARKRFAFEEIFSIQVALKREKALLSLLPGYRIEPDERALKDFLSRLPFALTDAQARVLGELLGDVRKGSPMNRLVEGDVGSGKTAVAAALAFMVGCAKIRANEAGNLQVAYMAPTEILAKQHFESFVRLFSHLPVSLALITGSGCFKAPSKVNGGITSISRPQLLKWIASGEIPIVIGTHALIQKTVKFKDLALVIVDEQHRFGVNARKKLARKDGAIPHFLSMTATPIPRTLALTLYGDLDLSVIDTLPMGRKVVHTEVLANRDREKGYEILVGEIDKGRQGYVICPRIYTPTGEDTKASARSVEAEAARLTKKYAHLKIGAIHGKLRPPERDRVMAAFTDGAIDVLVATSIVEVGVNVPNATVMVIEESERFGLAQLHQLRGRVQRSTHQSYCFALTERDDALAIQRLKAFVDAKDGFALAEYDLSLRGSGELAGGKQWGATDLAMEAMRNPRLVSLAREEAENLVTEDLSLRKYPALKERINMVLKETHLE